MKISGSLIFKILSTLEFIFDLFFTKEDKSVEPKKEEKNEDKN